MSELICFKIRRIAEIRLFRLGGLTSFQFDFHLQGRYARKNGATHGLNMTKFLHSHIFNGYVEYSGKI